MRERNQPPNDREPQPRQQEIHGEHQQRPTPLRVHQGRKYVLQVLPPPLRHVTVDHVAVAVLEDDPLAHPPGVEPRLPVPGTKHCLQCKKEKLGAVGGRIISQLEPFGNATAFGRVEIGTDGC